MISSSLQGPNSDETKNNFKFRVLKTQKIISDDDDKDWPKPGFSFCVSFYKILIFLIQFLGQKAVVAVEKQGEGSSTVTSLVKIKSTSISLKKAEKSIKEGS